MNVKYIRAKSILTKSTLGKYTINHYVGCHHACTYCYARLYGKKYYGLDDWDNTVIVKQNAVQLARKSVKPGMTVWMSSMSDPYQPIEAKEKLTRQLIGVLGAKGANIEILTKSPLVLRDADLIKRYDALVGFTIVSTRRIDAERRAPHPKARIEALKKLKENGIRTYLFVGPILPETDVEEIVRQTHKYADFYYFDRLRHVKELGMEPFWPDKAEIMRVAREYEIKAHILF